MSHEEFIALCESYSTLTDEGREEALAEIVCYVKQLELTRYAKRVARFANEDDLEGYLSSRQGW
jgi:hypothetical protein